MTSKITVAIFLLFTFSCKKENDPYVDISFNGKSLEYVKDAVRGKWQLVREAGGYVFQNVRFEDQFVIFQGDTVVELDHNVVTVDTTVTWSASPLSSLTLSGLWTNYYHDRNHVIRNLTFWKIEHDTLILLDNVSDGYERFLYRSKSN